VNLPGLSRRKVMPFCGICLATVDEEDMVSTLDDVCLRCYEQQMRDTEDAALLADLESELVAIKRHDLVSDGGW